MELSCETVIWGEAFTVGGKPWRVFEVVREEEGVLCLVFIFVPNWQVLALFEKA